MTDRPATLDERYGAATCSAHLEVRPGRCSVDYLVAAGWCRERLGAQLLRLRTEFDAVRSTRRPDGDALTERVLSRIRLTSLRDTSDALHKFAAVHATRTRTMLPDDQIHTITGRALELWLDPICPACSGLGGQGQYLAHRCDACDGSGNRGLGPRAYRLATSSTGHSFGRALMAHMDRLVHTAERRMGLALRTEAVDEQWSPAHAAELTATLTALRSRQAQED